MGVDNTGSYICVPVMAETCVGNPADSNDDYICNTQQVGQHCYFTGGDNGDSDFPPLDDLPEPEVWYGGGSPNPPSSTAVKNQIKNKPFALLDIPCDIIRNWVATAKRQVAQAQIAKLDEIVRTTTIRPGITTQTVARLQDINNAYSTVVNMDYFPVTITQLPIVNGQRLTAPQFLEHIRKNINGFVNTAYTEFTPYQWYGVNETTLWNSSNPLGAVVALDMQGPDNGSVIVSHHGSDKWTFSTIFDPKYGQHPVSGHRDFGYIQNANGSYTFYTRGVDRLTSFDAAMLQAATNIPFGTADALWNSFQGKINEFVKNNGGSSAISTSNIHRPNWNQVKDVLEGRAPLNTLSKDCPD